jgi:peptidoglycan/LPS O-acetylase OafA/YrhL
MPTVSIAVPKIGIAAPSPVERDQEALRSGRYHTLDLWRGIASLMVVLFHSTVVYGAGSTPVKGGLAEGALRLTYHMRLGVPMFFVISGFCIAASVDAAASRRVPAAEYFRRRFRRIFPAYWAALGLHVIAFFAIDQVLFPGLLTEGIVRHLAPWTFGGAQWLGNLTLTESWRWHLFGRPRGYVMGQSWTLCYEEQFYAVTAVLLAIAPRRLFPAAAAVTLAALGAQMLASALGVNVSGWFFDGGWTLFALGGLVYWVLNHRSGWKLPTAAALAIFAGASALRVETWDLPFALGFSLVILMMARWDGTLIRMRALAPLRFLGRICYSLYLVHVPFVFAIAEAGRRAGLQSSSQVLLMVVPVCIAASILLAWGFHHVVERRFLNPPLLRQP